MLWLLPLKRYFKFDGRSGRAEYWQFLAFYIIVLVISAVIDESSATPYRPDPSTLIVIAFFAMLAPLYAVTFRRLHDRNISGRILVVQTVLGFAAGFGRGAHNQLQSSVIGIPFLLLEYAGYLAGFAVSAYVLWQFCLPGDAGENRFGPPPTDTVENAPKMHEVVASITETTRGFAPKAAAPDEFTQLERLAKLRNEGVLTDAEFETQKAAILARQKG